MNDRSVITAEDIENLREILHAATPRPWEAWRQYDPTRGHQYGVANLNGDDIGRIYSGGEDAALIEAATNSLPALLDKIADAWDEGAQAASPHGGAYLRSILIGNPYRKAGA